MYLRSALLLASVTCALPASDLTFEVASVKPATVQPSRPRRNTVGQDRIDFPNATLWYCITYAYGVRSYQVSGPDWLRDARYEIAAKAPAGYTRVQFPKMMQTLLAERFNLKLHHETRDIPALALIVGRNGPKLKESAPESGDGQSGAHVNMSASPTGSERLDVTNAPISTLANTLSALLGRPVVDRTGLTGRYDFALEFTRDETAGHGASGGYNEPPPLPPPPPGAEPGLSVYSSIQQLGLKLEAQKLPLDVIVIDHAEKTPEGN